MGYQQVIATRRGGPEVLALRTAEIQPPPDGHALVRVAAAGVSFGDILVRVGVIPGGPKPPFAPGYDIAGTVEQVGAGVAGLAPGQRVAALLRLGGYSAFVTVPAARLVPLPDGVEPVEAAAAALNYFVAYQMLHRVAKVRPGQQVLVHGAGGGVGTALLQLARRHGVACLGTGSARKHELISRYGATPIDYRETDFVNVANELPGGGVDAVFDPIGGGNFGRSRRALRRGGILVGFGQSAALRGAKPHRPTAIVGFLGGIILAKLIPDGKKKTFYNAFSLEKKAPDAYRQDLSEVLRLLAQRSVEPVIARTLPLEDAAKAHEMLERGETAGKIVLTPATV
jgi:NADPH:quinone reductase-like Zn-dependent oxidoreductase